jgi:uncharacterized membrane protein HdeD (DUF308 family)
MMTSNLPSQIDHTEAMNDVLVRNWWVAGLRGVLAILFSILAILLPGETILSLVLLFAAFSFSDGIVAIVLAIRGATVGSRWGMLLLNGILGVLVGIGAFLWPAITVLAFILLLTVWALISGVTMLVAAFRLKKSHGRGWLAFGGIASILYGILLLISPLIGAIVLAWWLGIHALVFGVAMLFLAFRLRSHHPVAGKAA